MGSISPAQDLVVLLVEINLLQLGENDKWIALDRRLRIKFLQYMDPSLELIFLINAFVGSRCLEIHRSINAEWLRLNRASNRWDFRYRPTLAMLSATLPRIKFS